MRRFYAFGCLLVCASLLGAGEARRERTFLIAQYDGPGGNRILEVSAEGKLLWEHKVPSLCILVQPIPGRDRHLLYAYGGKPTGVREIDRDQKIVWEYVSRSAQVLTCERLPNGDTLIGEQGPCQVVTVSPQGEVRSTVKLPTSEKEAHHQLRAFHALPTGNLLAALEGEGAAREVDPAGKLVWEVTGLANVFEALRLENGNTLVACGTQKRVIEVTREGKVVWELTAQDVPDVNLTWVTSLQVLKNGHYLVGNFLRGQEGRGAHAFEVTRDKRVVWAYEDHDRVKTATMVRALGED